MDEKMGIRVRPYEPLTDNALQKTAMAETEAVFSPLRKRIAEAVSKLEEQIAISESEGTDEKELAKAREVLGKGRAVAGDEI
jgi:tubulin-specific chaperone A